MSPRRYDMSKRVAAREETRRRIVEATVKLHGERGVFGTTYRDIAREADVSLATVYAHFPAVEDLLPACGAVVMERARPPRAGDAERVIGDATEIEDRLRRVAAELFAFYERGGRHLDVDARERELPGMRQWEESQRATVAAFVRAALVRDPGDAAIALISAFFDLPTFRALRARGVEVSDAARAVARAAVCSIDGHARPQPRREPWTSTSTRQPRRTRAGIGGARRKRS
jgi:AcrR family transcriptional regulator